MVHPPNDLNLRPFKVRGLMNSTLVGDWKSANGFRNFALVLKRYKVYNMFFIDVPNPCVKFKHHLQLSKSFQINIISYHFIIFHHWFHLMSGLGSFFPSIVVVGAIEPLESTL